MGSGLGSIGVSAAGLTGKSIEVLFPDRDKLPSPRQAHLRTLQGQTCSFDAEVNGRDLQAHIEPHLGEEDTILLGRPEFSEADPFIVAMRFGGNAAKILGRLAKLE
jgi:hypothetical protein